MSIESTISKINKALISAFAQIDSWFDEPEFILRHRLSDDSWCPAEILEHIMLTNHFLLKLIDKGSKRAISISNERDTSRELTDYNLENSLLEQVGEPGWFSWKNPAHMQPNGSKPLAEIREELRNQLYRCLCHLELLRYGQGAVYQISMSVNGLGKLDMYQYIYFVALHAKRHIIQLEKYSTQNVK